MSVHDTYNALCAYTLGRGDRTFIHQHVVDAFAAQHAGEGTKPIGLTFALVGLYLHVERGFSGRQVQRVHMALAKRKRVWPVFPLPQERGRVTVFDVFAAAEGRERDTMIDLWCASVWQVYRQSHHSIVELLRQHGISFAP